MSDTVLSTHGLCAHYGDFQALFDVDLNVENGDVIAIIGANGAGKTTLLHSIAGLCENAPQQISYRGQAIGALRADQVASRGIALVPEGRQLFASLTVEENLVIGAQTGGRGPWHLQALYELFPMLKERRESFSTQLSGGQQQMVAIGRALMANPDLILLDEVSLGLAPVIIKSIYEALPDIVSEGMTALIVEQDISKALAVSSRFYCLQEGRVALAGSSHSVSREAIGRAYFGSDVSKETGSGLA